MFERHRNPNGTYNGVTLLAELTGITEAEIKWTFERLKVLRAEGKTSAEAKTLAAEEAKGKPWL